MLRDLIENNVQLGKEDKKGWRNLRCPLCNDHKPRGAFNFNNNEVVYNCFNCSTATRYNEGEQFISKKLRSILNLLNIADYDIDTELGKNFFIQSDGIQPKREASKCFTPEIALPNDSYLLRDADSDDIWATVAKEYLSSRGLSEDEYDWYLSKDPTYTTRIIIPYYRRGKIIYWQARTMDETNKLRYLNAEASREAVIFGYNFIEEWSDKPLFVTEGIFDAINVKGVSLLGSTLNECKINALDNCQREKVFIIDKDKNGYKLGIKALNNGWSISFVDGDVKDVNEAVQKYGKLWTMQNIMSNIQSDLQAKVTLEFIRNAA